MATATKTTPDPEVARVERHRKKMAEASRRRHAKASDVGLLPPIENPTRRAACAHDLHLFEQVYFPHSTGLAPFGPGQTNVLSRIQGAVMHRGRILNCEPRGFAKSTKSENAILWAALYGHRSYAVLFGATAEDANDAISSIKTELQENELLLADFPEVCYPIRKLEGRAIRALTQTFRGELTHIGWRGGVVVFPTIPGSVSSAAIIESRGYTAASRGIRFKRPDGRQSRPDLVIVDDPQTDESAASPAQVLKRMSILQKSILRLGGHGKQAAVVMNATVIADGDMVDQLADHKLHPEWESVRVRMVEQMPDALETLWLGDYKRIRDDYDADVIGAQRQAHRNATAFYVAHRDEMDAGARVAWEWIPLEPDEISAIQHAMNILCDDGEEVFASECQNEPRRAIPAGVAAIDRDEIQSRVNGLARGVVPAGTASVVAHVDVHDSILYWTVSAISQDFTGAVVDYGVFPQQPGKGFSWYSIKRKLVDAMGTDTTEEAIATGVAALADELGGRVWATPDGEQFEVGAMLFDIGYKPEETSRGILLSRFKNICYGARGVGIGPTEKPMPEYEVTAKRMRRAGPQRNRPRWYIPRETINGVPIVRFDANYWKSVTASRLMQNRGTAGEWSLFGTTRTDHSHYASHLIAETPIPTTNQHSGLTVTVWKLRPNHENHWFDTLVGCTVAGSLLGIQLPGGSVGRHNAEKANKKKRRRITALQC